MTIAVDPKVIPLGSKVLLLFDNENYKKYNGVYSARDIGGAIKGNRIDLFMGDFKMKHEAPVTDAFGAKNAKAIVLRNIS